MIAETPYYKIKRSETMLQGYLYKYVVIYSTCPSCHADISGIDKKHFFCVSCGQEIERDNKPRKISAEFFELDGEWLCNDLQLVGDDNAAD